MSELISEASRVNIEDALVSFINNVAKAQDFAVDQIPDVMEEMLRWEFIDSLFSWGLCISCIAFSLIFFILYLYKVINYDNVENNKYTCEAYIFICIVFGMSELAWLVMLADWEKATVDWLQIWLTPKSYLIDYAFQLVK